MSGRKFWHLSCVNVLCVLCTCMFVYGKCLLLSIGTSWCSIKLYADWSKDPFCLSLFLISYYCSSPSGSHVYFVLHIAPLFWTHEILEHFLKTIKPWSKNINKCTIYKYTLFIYISGWAVIGGNVLVNVRLYRAIKKKISPLIYLKVWLGAGSILRKHDDFHPDILARMYT